MNQLPTIVIACDQPYYLKAQAAGLFDSLMKHAPTARKLIFCIGFAPDQHIGGFEYAHKPLHAIKSYREGWPANRSHYVCAEGGEWLQSFLFDDNELIIHIDADMIMQRPFRMDELEILDGIKHDMVAGTPYTIPYTTLREELWKLLPKSYSAVKQQFAASYNQPMWCAGMVVARAGTYRQLSADYLDRLPKLQEVMGHHAAGQWLMNYVAHYGYHHTMLPPQFHCADWFIDMPTGEKDGQLTVNREVVLFNHTKFNRTWKY